MTASGSRLRQIGWAVVLAICTAAFVALAFRVNAVESEVTLAERKIVALKRETLQLETEFEARASQQQLADWNALEFGFRAPEPVQFLENERQLASLGTPRGLTAPDPIRVARAPVKTDDGIFPAMVSPMTGKPMNKVARDNARKPVNNAKPALPLADRLAFAEAFPSGDDLAGDQASGGEE